MRLSWNAASMSSVSEPRRAGFVKGAAIGDIDNDGDLDLYVSTLRGDNHLYANRGDATFVDITIPTGVQNPQLGFATGFADFDQDGFLDIFAASYANTYGTTLATDPEWGKTTEGFVGGMFTKQYPKAEVDWVIRENLKFPRAYAARLLFDHATNDWRDVIPRINVPTLIVGGKTSLVGWRSQEWMGTQIKGSRVVIFEEAEGGNHFMFMENPAKFNKLVKDYFR